MCLRKGLTVMTPSADELGRWGARIPPAKISAVVRDALGEGLLSDGAAFFHDLDRLDARVGRLQSLFPASTLHGIAVKANPAVPLLRHLVGRGCGLECASMEEVELCLAAGCAPERIIFDSPAKSEAEIDLALHRGLWLNADNPEELARVARWVDAHGRPPGVVGLRINPLVGAGSIPTTSVGDRASKFGVPVSRRAEIVQLFGQYTWLGALHVHVGSQGCALSKLSEGCEVAVALAAEIEGELARPPSSIAIDIGGGLPTAYLESDNPPSLEAYVESLSSIEGLRTRPLATEFGRAVHANCGFAVSRIEYMKEVEGTLFAVIHLGADAFMRPVYQPQHWPHEFLLLDEHGQPKQAEPQAVTVAGPLCFGGDIISGARSLPSPAVGDWLVLRDTGAYTLSLWSRHCSRAMPAMHGFSGDTRFTTLKRRETVADLVALWGG